jgi:hypothetical protein
MLARTVLLMAIVSATFVAVADAGVPSDTWYRSDAQDFWNRTVFYSGDYSVDCCIGPVDDMGTCYLAVYHSSYTPEKVSAAVIAAAEVSSRTSWNSSYVGIMFAGGSGEAFAMTTADARYFYDNWDSWSDSRARNWVADNLIRL